MIAAQTDRIDNSYNLKGYFTELAAYNNWADAQVIDWLARITDKQWNQAAISSFGSIRQTALHIVGAKKIWIDFWTNVENPVYLSSTFTGSKNELLTIWRTVSGELQSFIEAYPLEYYSNDIYVMKPNGEQQIMEFRKTFPHMINHSTYHRGQLVTLLRNAGFSDFLNTDLFTYYAVNL